MYVCSNRRLANADDVEAGVSLLRISSISKSDPNPMLFIMASPSLVAVTMNTVVSLVMDDIMVVVKVAWSI